LTNCGIRATPHLPHDNPLTGEGVALVGKLFFDRRHSTGPSQSCASCPLRSPVEKQFSANFPPSPLLKVHVFTLAA
jgi:cytochrome c peroxidase